MEVKIIIQSEKLCKEELRLLIQSVRDCEQKSFPDKEISIWIEAPKLTTAEANEIPGQIKPGYKYGRVNLFYRRDRGERNANASRVSETEL